MNLVIVSTHSAKQEGLLRFSVIHVRSSLSCVFVFIGCFESISEAPVAYASTCSSDIL